MQTPRFDIPEQDRRNALAASTQSLKAFADQMFRDGYEDDARVIINCLDFGPFATDDLKNWVLSTDNPYRKAVLEHIELEESQLPEAWMLNKFPSLNGTKLSTQQEQLLHMAQGALLNLQFVVEGRHESPMTVDMIPRMAMSLEDFITDLREDKKTQAIADAFEKQYDAIYSDLVLLDDMNILGLTEKPDLFTGPLAPIDERLQELYCQFFDFIAELTEAGKTATAEALSTAVKEDKFDEIKTLTISNKLREAIRRYERLQYKEGELKIWEQQLRIRIRQGLDSQQSRYHRQLLESIDNAIRNKDKVEGLKQLQKIHKANGGHPWEADLAKVIRGNIGLKP